MSEIEKIYYNMDKLRDDLTDTEEVEETYEKLKAALGKSKMIEVEDYISDYAVSHEKQGFIWGFQYAVSLLTCGKAVTV